MLKFIAVSVALSIVPITASAQDVFVPSVTTANPGYLFPNDKYQRDRQQKQRVRQQQPSSRAKASRQIELDQAAKARVQKSIQRLVPEYNRRAKRDGTARADAWIRQKAFELGQKEAAAMKRRR